MAAFVSRSQASSAGAPAVARPSTPEESFIAPAPVRRRTGSPPASIARRSNSPVLDSAGLTARTAMLDFAQMIAPYERAATAEKVPAVKAQSPQIAALRSRLLSTIAQQTDVVSDPLRFGRALEEVDRICASDPGCELTFEQGVSQPQSGVVIGTPGQPEYARLGEKLQGFHDKLVSCSPAYRASIEAALQSGPVRVCIVESTIGGSGAWCLPVKGGHVIGIHPSRMEYSTVGELKTLLVFEMHNAAQKPAFETLRTQARQGVFEQSAQQDGWAGKTSIQTNARRLMVRNLGDHAAVDYAWAVETVEFDTSCNRAVVLNEAKQTGLLGKEIPASFDVLDSKTFDEYISYQYLAGHTHAYVQQYDHQVGKPFMNDAESQLYTATFDGTTKDEAVIKTAMAAYIAPDSQPSLLRIALRTHVRGSLFKSTIGGSATQALQADRIDAAERDVVRQAVGHARMNANTETLHRLQAVIREDYPGLQPSMS